VGWEEGLVWVCDATGRVTEVWYYSMRVFVQCVMYR
jgi:hypothetical protein